MRLQLLPEVAPMHATSTIYLTLLGFYDTLTFHRIIKGFMAQGGDPLGNGSGSPGYTFAVEVSAAAKHDVRGVLSMANAGANTEGSQFFITFGPQPSLDGKYSVFGKLVSGLEALSAIEAAGTAGEGKPALVTITAATVSVE
jgi:peptidylprolyl isomerase